MASNLQKFLQRRLFGASRLKEGVRAGRTQAVKTAGAVGLQGIPEIDQTVGQGECLKRRPNGAGQIGARNRQVAVGLRLFLYSGAFSSCLLLPNLLDQSPNRQ